MVSRSPPSHGAFNTRQSQRPLTAADRPPGPPRRCDIAAEFRARDGGSARRCRANTLPHRGIGDRLPPPAMHTPHGKLAPADGTLASPPLSLPQAAELLKGTAPEITKVVGRQIFDSRGNPTVEAEVTTGKGTFRAAVPRCARARRGRAVRDGPCTRTALHSRGRPPWRQLVRSAARAAGRRARAHAARPPAPRLTSTPARTPPPPPQFNPPAARPPASTRPWSCATATRPSEQRRAGGGGVGGGAAALPRCSRRRRARRRRPPARFELRRGAPSLRPALPLPLSPRPGTWARACPRRWTT